MYIRDKIYTEISKKESKEMQVENLFANGFAPTFLFTWKGVRTVDEARYHVHANHCELAFIMAGHGKYKIDDKMYDVEEGDLLILNPGVYHQSLVSDPQHPTTEFFVGVSDFCLEGMRENCVELSTMPIYKTSPDLKQRLMRLCISMSTEKDADHAGKYYMMQSFLVQYLLYILRDAQETSVPGSRCAIESVNKNEIVSQIMQYFEEHYPEKISLDIISENMYVSPFYISKIFKTVTGDTPIRYLINVRLDKAKELLKTHPEMSVHEIAEMVGYDDAYHFSKLFKKRFGSSPSKLSV